MARVLVGSTYFLRLDPARWAERQPFPPLGTLYAVGTLRADGHDVQLFDAMIAGAVEDWSARLRSVLPDIAVLFDDNFNYLSKMCLTAMRQAALQMIAQAQGAGVPVLVCSADATDNSGVYLDAGAYAVVLGEGEETVKELVRHLETGIPALAEIRGIAHRETHGVPARTAPRGLIRDLDALPRPAWDLVDIESYRDTWLNHHGHFALNLVTSRGCPYRCNWCAKPIWGQSYAVRSAADVVDELAWLVATAAPTYIWFMDDIMGLKPRWWREFADALDVAGVAVPFKCLSRADLILRENAVADLKRAGCDIVWLGAESGSQKILDAMDKDITTGEIIEATTRLKSAGVRVGHFLQFGYPGEDMREIGQTLDMLRTAAPDELGISVSYPLPGTRFYERVASQLRRKRHWTVSSDLAMLYRGPFTTVFYRRLHIHVHRLFRLQRALRQWREALTGKGALRWALLRAMAVLVLNGLAAPVSWVELQVLRWMPHSTGGVRP